MRCTTVFCLDDMVHSPTSVMCESCWEGIPAADRKAVEDAYFFRWLLILADQPFDSEELARAVGSARRSANAVLHLLKSGIPLEEAVERVAYSRELITKIKGE